MEPAPGVPSLPFNSPPDGAPTSAHAAWDPPGGSSGAQKNVEEVEVEKKKKKKKEEEGYWWMEL